MSEQIEGIDFAVAAYREEGVWQVQELAHDVLTDIERLAAALRRFPGDGGAHGPDRDRRGLLPDRPGHRPGRAHPAVRHHRRRRVGDRPFGGRGPRPARARGRRRPGARRRSRPPRRPRHERDGHGASCSTTSTSIPTRCSPTWPAGWASARSSTRPSASPLRDAIDGVRRGDARRARRGARRAGVRRRTDRGRRPRPRRGGRRAVGTTSASATATPPATPSWSRSARPRPGSGSGG